MGNVIGSNIFNILFVLGISGVISPVAFMMDNIIDIVILIIMSIFVWVFGWTKRDKQNRRYYYVIDVCCLSCVYMYSIIYF